MSKEKSVKFLPGLPPFSTYIIYVLEDGETYSGEPTRAVEVTQEQLEEIEDGSKVSYVVPDWDLRDENGAKQPNPEDGRA
jgi:hypothetical protein